MKIAKITLFVVSLLLLGVFLLGNQMTPNPGTSSGNGNPALLIAFLLIPAFVFMVFLWVRIFHVHPFGNTAFTISILAILVHLSAAFIYQRYAFIEYRQVIKEALLKIDGVADEEYLQSITSGLSIHVNNQYFNLNTYFMFVTFSILIAIVYTIFEKKEKANFK
ncbi:hypothetical protein [Sporosarcina sp. D27]|uniref:hypothetical protein n=1 Tax=Sporosarcina sp. D27 TaxID=1382305 RepID=UPI00046E8BA5|nr:hypothetical protein [Sporosarcina sp. D27]